MELTYNPSEKLILKTFYVERKQIPHYGINWHYHEGYELLLNLKGKGVRIVGDNIDYYEAPELILMGTNLPHLFKNGEHDENDSIDYIVLKFDEIFNGQAVFNLPELSQIKYLLSNSKRGILFSNKTINTVKKQLKKLLKSEGVNGFLIFMNILKTLSEVEDYEFLASEGFLLKASSKGENRIQKVMDYISENYTKDINLEDLAEVAFMTTNSFCRYFKGRTGKTVFQFIREFRINKACQMLIKDEKSISNICFDTGFNSFSTFNRIFKNLKNVSASEYRSNYLALNCTNKITINSLNS